jgi:predicted alpha/beta-hydrolase family hydrolase
MLEIEPSKFVAVPNKPEVSALLSRPGAATSMLVLGHGAGSTLRHPLVQQLSDSLNAVGIATFRFNYPYSETGRAMDPEAVRLATVRAAVAAATEQAGSLPVFAGGHSMSGRMLSLAHAQAPLPGVRGLVFLAFPLHPGAPEAARAVHLARVNVPLLFLSGTRDKMAHPALLEQVVQQLPSATLHWLDTADHGLKTLKRRSHPEPIMDEIARIALAWTLGHATK